jgi:hypothetical protein
MSIRRPGGTIECSSARLGSSFRNQIGSSLFLPDDGVGEHEKAEESLKRLNNIITQDLSGELVLPEENIISLMKGTLEFF